MADSRIDDLRRRLERDPGSRLFAQLAEELRKAGELEEAIGVARAGLAQHPAYPSARLTLGRALLDSGDPRAARVELETAAKGAPDNILANRLLAEALESLGDLSGALAQYRATLAVAPGDRNVEGRIEAIEARLKGAPPPRPAGEGGGAAAPAAAAPEAEVAAAGEAETAAEESAVAPTIRIRAPGEPALSPRRATPPPPPIPSRPQAPPAPAKEKPPAAPETRAREAVEAPVAPEVDATAEVVAQAGAAEEAVPSDMAPTLPTAQAPSFEPEEELPPTLPPALPAGVEDAPGSPVEATVPETIEAVPVARLAEPEVEASPVAEPLPAAEPTEVSRSAPGAPADPVAEPFAVSEPPPRSVAAVPPPAVQKAAAAPSGSVGTETAGSPLSSVTLAELYFQQGLLERAVEVYRQVLDEEPGNSRARLRLEEVEALVAAGAADLPVPAGASERDDRQIRRQALMRTIELLEGLLAAVRRR